MRRKSKDLYGGSDPRDLPLYSIAEASRYLKIPRNTIRSWIVPSNGRKAGYSLSRAPIIKGPAVVPPYLTFNNLVEAFVLRGLRTGTDTPFADIRSAIQCAESELGIERLLLRRDLLMEKDSLFMSHLGKFIELTRGGQLVIEQVLASYLKRLQHDAKGLPTHFYPPTSGSNLGGPRAVLIDPYIAFGRPVISKGCITTAELTTRYEAGESIGDLVVDYGIGREAVEQAILFERVA